TEGADTGAVDESDRFSRLGSTACGYVPGVCIESFDSPSGTTLGIPARDGIESASNLRGELRQRSGQEGRRRLKSWRTPAKNGCISPGRTSRTSRPSSARRI